MSDNNELPRGSAYLRSTARRAMVDDISHGVFPIVLVPDHVMRSDCSTSWLPICESIGSGFAIGDGRLVVTAAHVVEYWERKIRPHRADTQTLKLGFLRNPASDRDPPAPANSAREVPTRVIPYLAEVLGIHYFPAGEGGRRPHEDLALLLIGVPTVQMDIRALSLADEPAAPGDDVIVFGYPKGRDLHRDLYGNWILVTSISRGVVSAVFPVAWIDPGTREVFQIDAVIREGNSGGPVVDVESGRVLGVVVSEKVERIFPIVIPAGYLGDAGDGRITEVEGELVEGHAPVSIHPLDQTMGFARVIDARMVRRLVDSAPESWPRLVK